MAYISKITPLGSSTTYDLKASLLINTHVTSEAAAIPATKGLFGVYTTTSDSSGLSNDGHILSGTWHNNDSNFGYQLFIDTDPTYKMALRQRNSSGVWQAWKLIPMADGTNASGTWGISITGNAATATALSTSGTTAKFWRGDNTWSDTISGGTLKITANSNTTIIGSQNASFCHIYNSENIPFIFNNSVLTTGGNLGDSTYPFDNLTLGRSNGAGIYYKGTKNTYRMIRFIDNTSDTYGNGISIGGGGQTIIGGGESADTAAAQAGTAGAEIMQVCNDGDVQIISNLQDGWNYRKVSTFDTAGNLTLPAKLVCANVGNTTGGSYTESGLEIREYNYGLAQSDTWGNAPRMTFHWGNRVEAQIGLASNGWLYTTSGYGGNLTTNPHRFVIEQGGTWNISVSGNAATATSSQAVLSGGTIGNYSTSHATALKNWFDSYKASTPRNQLIAFYDVSGGNGSLAFGYFLSGYDSNPYGGFYCAHYNTPYYIGISSGTYTQSQIWKQGDAVTGAVWNDYAEYREATPDSTTPGYVVFENGDDTLSLTTERLQHFAGITSDTWGFAQGETEKAKTPIAVSGRVLAYTYRDRNEYKPGDCVCAAPGGTIDIMTREEIREWPDRIVGTVSCVPEYDEWGGGELADRPSVKVNGRIWIKVR